MGHSHAPHVVGSSERSQDSPSPTLEKLVADIALCIKRVDSRRPRAVNVRSREPFLPGIGPYPETQAVNLIVHELRELYPDRYGTRLTVGVPYPTQRRQKCDLCVGESPDWALAVEFKLLRLMGNNGVLNPNMLMHILSPYPQDRSALTDCVKLAESALGQQKAVVIYGFDAPKYPLEPAITAFELLAGAKVTLGQRYTAVFGDLVHPIHREGQVFDWQVAAGRS